MKTPTPRTDARFASGSYSSKVDFARQLERELAQVTAERDSTTKLLTETSNELIRAHAEIRRLKADLEPDQRVIDGGAVYAEAANALPSSS